MTKQIRLWKFDKMSGNDSRGELLQKNENYMDAIG
jgi:hypothetical protein